LIYQISIKIIMEKLQQISEHLKNKEAQCEVFTVPLNESAQVL